MAFSDRLSALDASFLAIEDQESHMHVAAVLLLDAAPLTNADGGLDFDAIVELVGSRLHQFPRYRQRLAWIPIENHPVWVDDADFNLLYHLRHTALPAPGSDRQLKRLAGRIMSQQLDRGKPLWEMWVVEGLSDGRFALIAKVHHCMIDGLSGVDLIAALLRPEPSAAREEPPPWEPRPVPSGVSLLGRDLARRVAEPWRLLGRAAGSLRDPGGAARDLLSGAAAVGETLAAGFQPASETPFNPPSIGPHRRFDWVRFDLEEVRRVAHAFGGTVNDVVLTCVAGATRAFLEGRGLGGLRELDFRVMVPISTRAGHERGQLGNRVAQLVVPLPLGEPDPIRRLRRVIEASGASKRSGQARGGELIESMGDWITPELVTQAVRLQARTRPYNLVVTNVPGPPIPLFMLEAPLLDIYPMVPLFKNQALGVALFGYNGGLDWGFNCDWDRLHDLHDYVLALTSAWAELVKAADAA